MTSWLEWWAEIWKKSVELRSCLGRIRLTFACSPRPCGRCRTWFGADGKVSIERWYLSPYVKKPFTSKVIKSFVSELRSRKCFSCFGIPMLYVYFTYPYIMGMQYVTPPCLTLSIIWYVSRVRGSNPGKWVVPFLHIGVVAIEKGPFGLHSTMFTNFNFTTIYIYTYIVEG